MGKEPTRAPSGRVYFVFWHLKGYASHLVLYSHKLALTRQRFKKESSKSKQQRLRSRDFYSSPKTLVPTFPIMQLNRIFH